MFAGGVSGPVAIAPGPFCFSAPFPGERFMNTSFIVTHRKPRNPLVAPAHMRRAGRHETPGHGARQQAAQALRRELSRLRTHSP
jgi:hypothetical protein